MSEFGPARGVGRGVRALLVLRAAGGGARFLTLWFEGRGGGGGVVVGWRFSLAMWAEFAVALGFAYQLQ